MSFPKGKRRAFAKTSPRGQLDNERIHNLAPLKQNHFFHVHYMINSLFRADAFPTDFSSMTLSKSIGEAPVRSAINFRALQHEKNVLGGRDMLMLENRSGGAFKVT